MTSTARILISGIAGIALLVAAGVGALALSRSAPDAPGERAAVTTDGLEDDARIAVPEDAPRHGEGAPRVRPHAGDDRAALPPERDRDRDLDTDRDERGDDDTEPTAEPSLDPT